MKVAFFTEGYDPFVNGVVTSIKTLRQALERKGHEVMIFAPMCSGYSDEDEKVVRLPSVRWMKDQYPCLSPLAGSLDVLAGQNFELIHSHHPFTMSRLAERLAIKHDLPLVYSFHTMLNEYGAYVPLLKPALRHWLTHRFMRHCGKADRVITATTIIKDFLQSQGLQTTIDVVAQGVPAMQPSPRAREKVRGTMGLTPEIPLLLYAGRLAQEKRLDFLLRAIARLGKARHGHLHCAACPRE